MIVSKIQPKQPSLHPAVTGFMRIPRNQEKSDMQPPEYPMTPLRQIAIILAHCIVRLRNKQLLENHETPRVQANK